MSSAISDPSLFVQPRESPPQVTHPQISSTSTLFPSAPVSTIEQPASESPILSPVEVAAPATDARTNWTLVQKKRKKKNEKSKLKRRRLLQLKAHPADDTGVYRGIMTDVLADLCASEEFCSVFKSALEASAVRFPESRFVKRLVSPLPPKETITQIVDANYQLVTDLYADLLESEALLSHVMDDFLETQVHRFATLRFVKHTTYWYDKTLAELEGL